MTRRFVRASLAVTAAAAVVIGAAIAQDGEDKSRFVQMLEGMLSTPGRQVSIIGLEGALSSNPTVEKIVVSDSEGPWLEIDGVEAVWSRMALLRRRLDIDSLSAERVAVLRKPAPAEQPSSEGGSAALPVDVTLDAFNVPDIELAPAVVGMPARLSASGSAHVTAEAMAARLELERQDRPGTLSANLRLEPEANALTADVRLAEPAGGLLAELLRLRGRPAVEISLDGRGPLADWRANLEMQADGARVLAGTLAVARADAAYRITADLAGRLETVAPAEHAALVAGDSRLALDVRRGDDGSIIVDSAALRSEGAELAASGALAPDLTPQNVHLTLRLGQAGRAGLPFVPGDVSVANLEARIGLQAGASSPWNAAIRAGGVESALGRIADLSFEATGQASNLANAAERATSFSVSGSADGVEPADASLAEALGSNLTLTASGSWAAGQPVTLDGLRLALATATAGFSGTATTEGLEGRFTAEVSDLAKFAGISGRELGGAATLEADGSVTFAAGELDLQLDGQASDLRLGIDALDPLLAGATRLQGGVARESDGRLSFEALTLFNPHASAVMSGTFSQPELDLTVNATVADLASVTPRAKGKAQLSARLTGSSAAPRVEAEATGEELVLMGRPLANPSARFAGVVAGPQTQGDAELSGTLGGVPVRGAAHLAAGENGARRLEGLELRVGESRASGDLTLRADGLIEGRLGVASPDLSKVAPLFLAEANGMLKADISLSAENGQQSATFSGVATDVVFETVKLDSADIAGTARDLFAAPQIDGRFAIRNLAAGGLVVRTATGTAESRGRATAFSVAAQLADGNADLAGSIQPRGEGLAIAFDRLAFARAGADLRLAAPTTILIENGTVRFDGARLNAGGGTVTVTGRAGPTLDINAELSAVPAALANGFAPDLGAEGSISGSVVVTGASSAPNGRFNVEWRNAAVAASRNAGLGPLAVTANGTLAGGTVNLNGQVSGADGLAIRVAGRLGTAAGAPLDLRITGAVPLSLGNRQLADRGAALQGALNVDVAVAGTVSAPRFSGRITSEGGGFIDPDTGIVLRDLSLAASVSNDRVTIDRLTARSGEGTVSVTGFVGLSAGLPVDVAATVRQARYVDGTLIATRFDADLTLTGSLSEGPALGGNVFLDRTEITVPEALPRDSVAVDVEHIAAPADVERTVELARKRERSGGAGGGSAGISLNVTINAPQQIFVRGRGLDAELGGDLRLSGTTVAIVTNGAFQMRRGRLDIFTQRITFDRGIVTFAGDLDPILDFAGTTQSQDITVTVTVTGRASDPAVNFSSVPELPQDEVLAHLIFNKGITELSPVQIARLAAAATQLSGGSGGGILNRLRESTGLDDLDIVTDQEGAPALAAGRYISENVYVGVQQGATAESTRVTIDLDITKDVKARGAISPKGDSSIGVFFEHEY